MVNKIFLLLALCWVFCSTLAMAQDEEAAEKIRAAKVAYITGKMSLNTSEAQVFWPIFNEYEDKHQQLKKRKRAIIMGRQPEEISDNELIADLRKLHEIRQEELNLDKEYLEKYLKVLTPQKVAAFYRAEREFNMNVMRHMHHRREFGGPGKGPGHHRRLEAD